MIKWKELKQYLEEQGIKGDDTIAQLQIEEGFTDSMERIESYFDHDKDGNRRLYVYFRDE